MTLRRIMLWLAFCVALGALPAVAPAQQERTARQMLLEARQWLAGGQLDQALKAYQAALDLAVDDDQRAQALLGMANVHRSERDGRAQLDCLKQIEALPAADPSYVRAARRQMLSLYRGSGDVPAARALAEKLLGEAASFEERLSLTMELADMDLEQGHAADAVRRLEPLLKDAQNSPALPDLLATLIAARILDKHWQEALALIRQATQRFPERADLLLRSVQLLQDQGQVEQAATLLQEALLARPDQPELLRALYELRHEMGQTAQLTDWLGKQARGEGREIWLGHLARIYEWDEQLPQAVAVYAQLIALRPNDVTLLSMAGQLALRAQDFARAATWLQQARALAPQDENLVISVGEVQLRQGQLQQALATWKQGLGYAADNPQAVQRLGGLLARHELYEAAVEVYREGRLASGQPTAYALSLGSAYEQLAAYPQAIREYVVALGTPDRLQTTAAAAGQLYHLADEDDARPPIIAALQATREQSTLPPDGLGVLLYARVLQGEDGTKLLADTPADVPDLTPVLTRVASRLESRERPELALPFYVRLMREPQPADQAAGMAVRVAELQLRTGDWRAALATLKPLVGAVSAGQFPADLRAQLAAQLGNVLLRYAHQPTDAIGAYEIAVQAAPQGYWARLAQWGQADALFALGEYAQALEEYDKLLRLGQSPSEPQPPGVPGMGRSRLGRTLPQDDYVAYQRAEALLRQGKLPEAAPAFHKLAADHPDSRYANDALQRVLLVQRLQQDPQGQAYLQALMAWDKGETDVVEKLLTALIAQTPPSGLLDVALLQMAELRAWQGDDAAAVAAYDQLPARCPTSLLSPGAAFAAAMLVAKTDRAQALTRLKTLIEQFGEATEADEARLIVGAWGTRQAAAGTP